VVVRGLRGGSSPEPGAQRRLAPTRLVWLPAAFVPGSVLILGGTVLSSAMVCGLSPARREAAKILRTLRHDIAELAWRTALVQRPALLVDMASKVLRERVGLLSVGRRPSFAGDRLKSVGTDV